MKKYIVTDEDILAICNLLDIKLEDGEYASITRDESTHAPFEAGFWSEKGYIQKGYGNGKTIALAINEALGLETYKPLISPFDYDVQRAMKFLAEQKVNDVSRK